MRMTALGAETLREVYNPEMDGKSFMACYVSLVKYINGLSIRGGLLVNEGSVRFTIEQICEMYAVAERLCTVAATMPLYLDIISAGQDEKPFVFYSASTPFSIALLIGGQVFENCARAPLSAAHTPLFSYSECLAIYKRASAAFDASIKAGLVISGLNSTQRALLDKVTEPDTVEATQREGGPFLAVKSAADCMSVLAYVLDAHKLQFQNESRPGEDSLTGNDEWSPTIRTSICSILSLLRLISVGNLEALSMSPSQLGGIFAYIKTCTPHLEVYMIQSDAPPLKKLVEWIEARSEVRKSIFLSIGSNNFYA